MNTEGIISADETLDELLTCACPSIQYRVRREILRQAPGEPEMQALQARILEDEALQEIAAQQQADGWLGQNFHGRGGMETGIRLLCEKGVEPDQPILARALRVLEKEEARLSLGLGRPGWLLDELGLGGTQTIRAAALAYAGVEDSPRVQAQVGPALAAFQAVLSVESAGEIVEMYRGRPVLRPGRLWPSLYHLRLLAWTQTWRSPQNCALMCTCVHRLAALSPLPAFNVHCGSQVVAPASFCMHDFNPDLAGLDAAHWMEWFQRMELLARLGVVWTVPELAQQAESLRRELAQGHGRFTRPMEHAYFRAWGAYTGLMLEKDWKDPRCRIYDLTFRSLLILGRSWIFTPPPTPPLREAPCKG
jgi:hypothetical protein